LSWRLNVLVLNGRTQMYQQSSKSPKSPQGFTLIELLVVIIMVSILSAIAIPGWLSFANNQRVSAVRSQVTSTLRKAQAQAKQTKLSRSVYFDDAADPPRIAVVPSTVPYVRYKPAGGNGDIDWQPLGEGEIKAGTLKLSTTANVTAITFDTYGTLLASTAVPVVVQVGMRNKANAAITDRPKRCVTVVSALGSLEEGTNAECKLP
jgi:prepilin-type N-terminal cleavage/methylation domain-containing protein